MEKAKILFLEDDAALHETVFEALEEEGYAVCGVYDGETAEDRLYETRFDLLLLDVNVPKLDGFGLLRRARARGVDTPALFLTTRDEAADVEEGFESGADDYVRKPFGLRELLLRVRSMLRRRFSHPADGRIDLGEGLAFDAQDGVLYRNGEAFSLGTKPRRLMTLLVERRGQVVSHEVIAEQLWDFDETPSDTALRTYIKALRKIVGKERIVSHKRTGYQFR